MAKKDLTDKELIKFSKYPPEKKKYIREGKGFTVRIMPSGSLTFLHIYTLDGKRKEDNLGHYPFVSLADARRKHRGNLDKLEDGTDPQAIIDPEVNSDPMTIEKLVQEYCTQREHVDKDGNSKDKEGSRTIKKDILPAWSERLASSIRRPDAIALVEQKALVDAKPGQARNIIKYGRAMFTFAMDRHYVEVNPFVRVAVAVPATAPRAGERYLSAEEIKVLWQTTFLPHRIKIALLLILATCQRPGEVIGMNTDEIEGDWWTIPLRRIKTRKTDKQKKRGDHRVYLSPFAKRLIDSLNFKDDYKGWLFPAGGIDKVGTISETALSHEVGKETKTLLGVITRPKYLGIPSWHPHDLRRTGRTMLSELEVPDEYCESILNHAKQGMSAVYNRYKYDKQKREALTKWGEYLEVLLGDKALEPTKEVFDIDEETLKRLVWRYPLTKIAINYGVSETAVRKRCNKFGIDRPPQGYWLKRRTTSFSS